MHHVIHYVMDNDTCSYHLHKVSTVLYKSDFKLGFLEVAHQIEAPTLLLLSRQLDSDFLLTDWLTHSPITNYPRLAVQYSIRRSEFDKRASNVKWPWALKATWWRLSLVNCGSTHHDLFEFSGAYNTLYENKCSEHLVVHVVSWMGLAHHHSPL